MTTDTEHCIDCGQAPWETATHQPRRGYEVRAEGKVCFACEVERAKHRRRLTGSNVKEKPVQK